MEKNRIEFIDICKAIAIYLMVLGHTGVVDKVNIFIHAFHMPLFFVLSGICFNFEKNNNFKGFIWKRFKTLIIPYLIFGIVLFVFWNGCLFILNKQGEMRTFGNLFTSLFWINTEAKTFGVVQWFLTCLFFTEMFFWLICKLCRNSKRYIFVSIFLLSIIGYLFSISFNFRLPLAIDSSLIAIFFYGLGYIFKNGGMMKTCEWIKKKKLLTLVIVFIVFICDFPLIFLNGLVNIRNISYSNYLWFIMNALVLSGVVMTIAYIVEISMKNKNGIYQYILRIGNHTLVVLLLNSTVIRMYNILLKIILLMGLYTI